MKWTDREVLTTYRVLQACRSDRPPTLRAVARVLGCTSPTAMRRMQLLGLARGPKGERGPGKGTTAWRPKSRRPASMRVKLGSLTSKQVEYLRAYRVHEAAGSRSTVRATARTMRVTTQAASAMLLRLLW